MVPLLTITSKLVQQVYDWNDPELSLKLIILLNSHDFSIHQINRDDHFPSIIEQP